VLPNLYGLLNVDTSRIAVKAPTPCPPLAAPNTKDEALFNAKEVPDNVVDKCCPEAIDNPLSID